LTCAARKIDAKITEETVRKSLILVATAIGGGVSYAAGVTELATGTSTDDPSTWRWQVSSILAAQNDTAAQRAETVADAFNQRYERYTPLGLPRPRDDSR
jgi:predicted secreted protein